MSVQELIEALKKCNQTSEVVIEATYGDTEITGIEIESVLVRIRTV
jgi:hypothetical protein